MICCLRQNIACSSSGLSISFLNLDPSMQQPWANLPSVVNELQWPAYDYEAPFYDYNENMRVMKYCEEKTCVQSCQDKMNLPSGKCFNNECYCQNTIQVQTTVKPVPKPLPVEPEWNYDNQNGATMQSIFLKANCTFKAKFCFAEWPVKYPGCAQGAQSPISLTSSQLRTLTRKISFQHFDEPLGLIVENLGHGSK